MPSEEVKALTDAGAQYLIDKCKAYPWENLANGAADSDALAANAVTTAKIANKAVTAEKLADGFLDTDGGAASFDLAYTVIEDMAILRFDLDLANVRADEEMQLVHVWEFPDDVTKTQGFWDESNKKYYSEVEG